MANNQKPVVVLLHGLHHNPTWLFLLNKRLSDDGFWVKAFSYHSLINDIFTHCHRLNQYLSTTHSPNTPLHIVAHSLGGLVARHFVAHYPHWQIGRIVTLGTPHLGSITAHIAQRITPFLLGNSYQNALDGHCPPLPEGIELGSIAGNRCFGLGLPVIWWHTKRYPQESDGTVLVCETKLSTAKDHLILPVNHLGLLYDKTVAKQTAHFLTYGQFLHSFTKMPLPV